MKLKTPISCLLFFSALLISLSVGVAGADAPDSQGSNSTQDRETAVIAFDDTTKVLNQSWSNEGVCITFQSDMPRIASITDINSIPDSGAGKVNFKQLKLANGNTRTCMDLERKRGNMAVTIGVDGNVVALSNPAEPLFSDITRTHFYVGMMLVGMFAPIQILFRMWLSRYMLKQGLVRN